MVAEVSPSFAMTSPMKPWETNSLQNSNQVLRSTTSNLPGGIMGPGGGRSAPVLPPLPRNSPLISSGPMASSYMPYSGGYGSMGYGGLGGYSSYGMPYRSSMYSSGLGGYGSTYGGMYGGYGGGYMGGVGGYVQDDAERRFIQYAEQSSQNTFANVESIVRAVNSISMMLDNTFFAMTSSFRAVLSVADNFGKLRSMFGHIWYSVNIFRLFNWLYRKLMELLGYPVPASAKSQAWSQAVTEAGAGVAAPPAPGGSSWPTLAFLGVLVSAPYIISKFLPKYEDKCDPKNWKSPGIKAKAVFDFLARGPTEMSVQLNDEITLAPTYVQEEMNLKNSGWAFAVANGKSGVVPLNYLVIQKPPNRNEPPPVGSKPSISNPDDSVPIPRIFNNNNNHHHKNHTKRVSFGENQIFENVDLEDYVTGKKEIKGLDSTAITERIADLNHSSKDQKKEEETSPKETKAVDSIEEAVAV